MSEKLMRIFLLLVVATFGVKVFAHARILPSGALMPRLNTQVPPVNQDGIKVGPCGGNPKVANPPVFPPGATITVNWEETIDHPGRYEFYFSQANDQNFGPALRVVIDNQNTPIMNAAQRHQYNTTITLPNVTCDNCTLQMIQYMTETNPPSLYYSCADLRLQMGAPMPPPSPTPGPGPAPQPVPTPSPHCN